MKIELALNRECCILTILQIHINGKTHFSVHSTLQESNETTTIEAWNKFIRPERLSGGERDDHNRGLEQVSLSGGATGSQKGRPQSRDQASISVRSASQAAKGTTTIEASNKLLRPEEPPVAEKDDHNRSLDQVSPSGASLRWRKGRPQSKPRSSISVRSVSQAAKRTTTIETSIKYLRPERSLGAEKDNHTYRG